MSTIKVNNLQNASAASPAIVLAADGSATAQVSSLNGGPLAGTRNRIINGDMRIDQRNAGASYAQTTTAIYGLDRWKTDIDTGLGRWSVQQVSDAPAGFTNSLKATITTQEAQPVNALHQIYQPIEGYNVADLAFGTASASDVTVSFWVKASVTGTYSLNVFSTDRSYTTSFVVNSADAWEYKTITVPGATDGTWATNNGNSMYLEFTIGGGTDKVRTADTWSSATVGVVAGSVYLPATSGATFQVTGVQLEPGTVATPFERRSYGQELALCQRYFQRGVYRLSGVCNGAGGDASIVFPTPFRSSPTLTVNTLGVFVDGLATRNITALTLSSTQETSSRIAVSAASSTAGRGMVFDGSNLSFDAEL